ncbi:hypothetical protein GEMRC1_010491 [Eukaryota sp. GEM-RC1]
MVPSVSTQSPLLPPSFNEVVFISPTTDSFCHKGQVTSIHWDVADRLLSTGVDQSLKLWDPQTGAHMDTHFGHQGTVTDLKILSFDPDTNQMVESIAPVSTGIDRTCRLWNLSLENHLCFKTSTPVISLDCLACFGKVGKARLWVTGSQNGDVTLWSDQRKRPIFSINVLDDWVISIAVHKNIVVAGGWNKVVVMELNQNPFKLIEIQEETVRGCVNQILIEGNDVICLVGREHRSGRWKVANLEQGFNGIHLFSIDN